MLSYINVSRYMNTVCCSPNDTVQTVSNCSVYCPVRLEDARCLPPAFSPSPSPSPSASRSPSPPPIEYVVASIVSFSSSVPATNLTIVRSEAYNRSTEVSEHISSTYSAFVLANGNSADFPTTWDTAQATVTNVTQEGFLIISDVDASPSQSVLWRSTLTAGTSPSASLTVSMLTNANTTLAIQLPSNTPYILARTALKFSIGIDMTSGILFNEKTDTLNWTSCYQSEEALGRYDLDHFQTTVQGEVVMYTFTRPISSLRLRVPTYAFADGRKVNVTHALNPAPHRSYSNGSIEICVQWSFPYFSSSLFYDPDLSVLVAPTTTNNDHTDQTSSDSTPSVLIISIVIPVAVGVCCLCAVVVVLAVVIWRVSATAVTRRSLDNRRGFVDL
eukprot:TRINITY_DN8816_c0_g1_i1.p1 TRINITY_DN8816_c0_g1~~TRINITY_DN8816_c0_g1_i1.p1  ORF type:complete len:388 (+),score=39.74 TRINITY_DN8816_c0_g1_i1:1197-2360(+)